MRRGYIIPVARARKRSQVGSKALKLGYLKRKGVRIPETYVCTFRAYDEYLSGNRNILTILEKELEQIVRGDRRYSVRSSANVEDETEHSFAGQFETYLDVSGPESICEAIKRIWQSIEGDKVRAYLTKIGETRDAVKMAVIIQEMITPQLSGVVFTKNPLNGLDEVIIESVLGLGEQLVQGGITPDRWVYKWGDWIERPANKDRDLPLVQEIVTQARTIAKKYGKPVDLEWVYDGKDLYWLQLREITSLRDVNIYSNRIAKEFLPGMIKPLIWSVNIPVVNSSWKRLFMEVIGKAAEDIDVHNLAKPFYYRAYFNMGVVGDIFELLGMPREALELLMGIEVGGCERPRFKPGVKTLKYLPRMLAFALKKSRYAPQIEKFLVTQRKKYDYFNSITLESLSEGETLTSIEELCELNKEASYFNIVTPLLMGFYTMLFKRQLKKLDIDIKDIDFSEVTENLRDIDPNYHLAILQREYSTLPATVKHALKDMPYDSVHLPEARAFLRKVDEFLLTFGHLSESGNDFSAVPWRETPDLIMTMVADYREHESKHGDKITIDAIVTTSIEGLALKQVYKKAARYREYRERINFLYTYGYGLFRPYFLHLGRLFAERGLLEDEQDIFYLTFDEIQTIVTRGTISEEHKKELLKRKEEVVAYADLVLPELIYGDLPPSPLSKTMRSTRLKGVAASKGYYEGRVTVIRGLQDFHKINEGDVIAIPHSDVSWTPLFAKAKAVISESGGLLSHAAIVAREYTIPAVVSVRGALDLNDGTMVGVSGYTGEVFILTTTEKNSGG